MNWYKQSQSGVSLWLDDERDPTADIGRRKGSSGNEIWVKTSNDAIKALEQGNVMSISLDHDLGFSDGDNGLTVANWIEEAAYYNKIPRLKWSIHSDNPAGRKSMELAMKSADRYWDQHELV